MQFEWDENKNKKNIQKHGLDFRDVARVFLVPHIEITSRNAGTDTVRSIAIGKIKGVTIAIIFVRKAMDIRIISARKARKNEKRKYHEIHKQ